ncbi:hypothetical protein D3C73_768130 [compost metagenome]
MYVVPAAASLITGISRARLCAALKALYAKYWDTDSIFVRGQMTEEELNERLRYGSSLLCPGVIPLTIGDGLGHLALEIKNAKGFLAGTKRYYLEGDDSYDEFSIKCATHGIPAIPYVKSDSDDPKEKEREERQYHAAIIGSLAKGKSHEYESKARPLKVKEAGEASRIGLFRSKIYVPKFRLDERLLWVRSNDETHWIGHMRQYNDLLYNAKDYAQIKFEI